MKKTPDDDLTYDHKRFGEFLGVYEGRVIPISDGSEVKVIRSKLTKRGSFWQLEMVKAAPIEEDE